MKQLLRLTVAMMLVFAMTTVAFGMVHSAEGEVVNTDTFYSITPNTTYGQIAYRNVPDADSSWGFAEYYVNDQTFASFGSFSDERNQFTGSYLFNFGLFIGLDYKDWDETALYVDNTIVSPGFRFNLSEDKNSYVAFSVDWYTNDIDDDILGYDLDLRYFFEKGKISGQIYDFKDAETQIDFDAAFAINENWVIGFGTYFYDEDSSFDAGFTFTTDAFILDFQAIRDVAEENGFTLSGLFNINESFGVGLRAYKYEADGYEDAKYSVLFKYNAKEAGSFKLIYTPENDTWPTEYQVAYFIKF